MQLEINFIEEKNIVTIIPLLRILDNTIEDETLKERIEVMLTQGYKCIGMFVEEKLIGVSGIWIHVKYYVGKHIEPDNVFILPEYQNRGLGEKLMNWIEKYAKENGCIASELNCYINNKRAQKFWETHGYKPIGIHYQKKYNPMKDPKC